MNWIERSNLSYALMVAQERAGVQVNVEKLQETYKLIEAEMATIEEKVNPHLPNRDIPKSRLKVPPKVQFKKDGSLSANALKYFDGLEVQGSPGNWLVQYPDGSLERLPTSRPKVLIEPMGVDNDADIKKWLLEEHGWRPMFWNISPKTGQRTSPKFHQQGVVCPDLERIDWPYLPDLIDYLSLKNRRNIIYSPASDTKKVETGWLADPRLQRESRLSAGSSGLTNTHRQKHKKVVNLPGVNARLGKEIRSCFIPYPGQVLVGYDASALEDRCKAHLTYKYDGGEYANKILDPKYDVHIESAQAWFPKLFAQDARRARQEAKPGNYALPYGCGVKKLATVLRCSVKEAEARFKAYWENNKPVAMRAEELKRQYARNGGYIVGLDGRPFHIRSDHKVFNTECQGSGSIIMDLSAVLMYKKADSVDMSTGTCIKNGKKYTRVLYMHDEYLWSCDPDIADWVLKEGLTSIQEAGSLLKLEVPLEADGCIGSNYAEVH